MNKGVIKIAEDHLHQKVEELIEVYGDELLRVCYLYLKDINLAQDALQDTYLNVFRSLGKFRGESSEKTWMMKITINVCKNYTKNYWNRNVIKLSNMPEIPYVEQFSKIVNDELLSTIMELPIKSKEVILLYYYQEYKIKEIAEILNISETAVNKRLARAKAKLKKYLEAGDWDEEYKILYQ